MSVVNVERDEKIAQLTKQGYSASQIAVRVGVTPRSVSRARRRMKLTQPIKPPLTDDERQWIEQLMADGASRRDIALTVGRTPDTLIKHWPDYGWDRHQIGEASAMKRKLARIQSVV